MNSEERGLYNFEEYPNLKCPIEIKKILFAIIPVILIVFIISLDKNKSEDIQIYEETVQNTENLNQVDENIEIFNEEDSIVEEDLNKYTYGYIDETVFDEKYIRYYDEEYGFYCAIPSNYNVSDSIGGANRIVVADDDSKTLIFIGATQNNLSLSGAELMNQYIAELGNVVDYKANGETWYAVSKTQNDVYYYRKCFIADDLILWFEFNVKSGSSEKNIGEYIEYIEDNFKIIKD